MGRQSAAHSEAAALSDLHGRATDTSLRDPGQDRLASDPRLLGGVGVRRGRHNAGLVRTGESGGAGAAVRVSKRRVSLVWRSRPKTTRRTTTINWEPLSSRRPGEGAVGGDVDVDAGGVHEGV